MQKEKKIRALKIVLWEMIKIHPWIMQNKKKYPRNQ